MWIRDQANVRKSDGKFICVAHDANVAQQIVNDHNAIRQLFWSHNAIRQLFWRMNMTTEIYEHESWIAMCEAFEALTLQSINEAQCNALVSRIRLWGESLFKLRIASGADGTRHSLNVEKEEIAKLLSQPTPA